MNPEELDGGAPAQGTAVVKISTTTRQHDHQQATSGPLLACGVFYPPAGRRYLAVVVVRTCPACGGTHLHRADSSGDVDGTDRRGSCGAAYVVQLVDGVA